MSGEAVLLEQKEEHVLVLTMNRPERHHALNRELSGSLSDAIARAEADEEVRVIVITGAGLKAFCAGADMLEVSGVEHTSGGDRINAFDPIGKLSDTPIPVIAAINGYCYGGGARLAVACDILLASDNATFRLPGAEYGLVVAAASLPRLVGSSKAKELIFSARKLTAEEAERWGLVNQVVAPGDLIDETWALARRIAAAAPLAVEAIMAVNRTTRGRPLDEAFAHLRSGDLVAYERMLASDDAQEGPRAFTEKREPHWQGR